MTDIHKILAQSNPAATTLTDVYTVPASTQTVISSLFVCNRGGGAATFRISIAEAGAADNVKQYLYYDISVPANDCFASTTGITLAETDVVRVFASDTNLSFNLFGVEVQ